MTDSKIEPGYYWGNKSHDKVEMFVVCTNGQIVKIFSCTGSEVVGLPKDAIRIPTVEELEEIGKFTEWPVCPHCGQDLWMDDDCICNECWRCDEHGIQEVELRYRVVEE